MNDQNDQPSPEPTYAEVLRVAQYLMDAWGGSVLPPGERWLDTARAAIAAGLDPRRVP